MASRGQVRIEVVPDVARTVRALRILERLAVDLGDAFRDAATDLELLAPDDDELIEVQTDPEHLIRPGGR